MSADEMLKWVDDNWPSIETDAYGSVIARLEPGQSSHNMFRGKNVREALMKAITTPPFKGPFPQEFGAMTIDEQLAWNYTGL